MHLCHLGIQFWRYEYQRPGHESILVHRSGLRWVQILDQYPVLQGTALLIRGSIFIHLTLMYLTIFFSLIL